MTGSRPLFAFALLAVAVFGAVVAPAVHWAGHGHEAPVEVADGVAHAGESELGGHAGECPDCAHIQKLLGSERAVLPFYAGVVGLERSAPPPEAPAVQTDVATPEGRGPPAAA